MKLKEIVEQINTSLKTTLKQERFQNGVFYGLAKPVLRKETDDSTNIVPVIYTDGKEIKCQVDDNYSMNLYHRCVSITSAIAENNQGGGFGDGDNILVETANMVAVVWASQSIGFCQEDLASIIHASFPSSLTISELSLVKIKTTSINIDSFAVYNQEYKSTEYPLKPEDYYFSIGYQVETTFDRSCVEKCC